MFYVLRYGVETDHFIFEANLKLDLRVSKRKKIVENKREPD